MIYNSIFIGFPWNQEFLIDDASLPDDEVLHITFRKSPRDPVLVALTDGDGITRTATGFIVSLTEAQTRELRSGSIVGDITTTKAGVDRHLGVRITVPVVRSTRITT